MASPGDKSMGKHATERVEEILAGHKPELLLEKIGQRARAVVKHPLDSSPYRFRPRKTSDKLGSGENLDSLVLTEIKQVMIARHNQ